MSVQVAKHSLSPAQRSSCSPGALGSPPLSLGISGAGHSKTESMQAASLRACSETLGVQVAGADQGPPVEKNPARGCKLHCSLPLGCLE